MKITMEYAKKYNNHLIINAMNLSDPHTVSKVISPEEVFKLFPSGLSDLTTSIIFIIVIIFN